MHDIVAYVHNKAV